VTWASYGQDGSNDGVFGQLFDKNLTKVRSEFQVNTFTNNSQSHPSVASFNNGNFVVTWDSEGQDGDWWGVYGHLFDENGTKISSEFRINTYTTNYQQVPTVASFINSDFVVIWASQDQDGSSWGIYGQLYNGSGSKIGSEFQVNTYTTNFQYRPAVASFNDGNFVVTWESYGQDGFNASIDGQLFDDNGAKIGNEFQVNTYTTNDQRFSSVTGFRNGNFVVIWNSFGQDGSDWGIYGQLFHDNITNPTTSTITNITTTSTSSTTSSTARLSTTRTIRLSITTTKRSSIISTTRRTPFSSTSDIELSPTTPLSNQRLLWLWLLLGIGGGTACLGLTGYYLSKKRKERASVPEQAELEVIGNDPHRKEDYKKLSDFRRGSPERNYANAPRDADGKIGYANIPEGAVLNKDYANRPKDADL